MALGRSHESVAARGDSCRARADESFHLKWLKSAGLVSAEREGRYLRYHARRRAIAEWQRHLEGVLPVDRGTKVAAGPRPEHIRPRAPAGHRTPSPSPGSSAPAAGPGGGHEGAESLPAELL